MKRRVPKRVFQSRLLQNLNGISAPGSVHKREQEMSHRVDDLINPRLREAFARKVIAVALKLFGAYLKHHDNLHRA